MTGDQQGGREMTEHQFTRRLHQLLAATRAATFPLTARAEFSLHPEEPELFVDLGGGRGCFRLRVDVAESVMDGAAGAAAGSDQGEGHGEGAP